MTPNFKVITNTIDITAILKDRLISLRVTNEAGIKSDTVEIQLDDRDNRIQWPVIGEELTIFLGYNNTQLTNIGRYIIDEVSHAGPPDKLTIRGKATNTIKSIKAPKTRSWDNVLLGDIVKTIAAEHDVIPRIAEILSNIRINHEDQTEESDLHFLTRLAKKNGAIAKLANKNIIIAVEGDSKAISGKNLPIINLNRENVIQHRLTQAERGKYKTIIARWHDTQAAQKMPITAGEGKPAFTIRYDYSDAEEARRAAEAKLKVLNRGSATLSLTLIGDTRLQAEGKLQLDNFREPINSGWLVKHVEHQLNNNGFRTRLDAEVPNL